MCNVFRMACTNCGGTRDVSLDDPVHRFQWCDYCLHLNEMSQDDVVDNTAAVTAMKPRDLRFHEASPYQHDDEKVLIDLKTSGLTPAVSAFLTNLRRLKSLLDMPSDVTFLAILLGQAHYAANESDGDNVIEAKFKELLRNENVAPRWRSIGEDGFKELVSLTDARLWHGMESNLIAQITGAWTAVEVLAGDLWEAALNAHPSTLASLSASPKGVMTDEEAECAKTVELSKLSAMRFNVADKMGSILRGKFNFTILNGIRGAYLCAFDEPPVRSAIESDSLKILSYFRNLIVHKAGVIDKQFEKAIGKTNILATTEIGQRIPIDGALVQKVVAPAIEASLKLITSVDGWLDRHIISEGETT